MAKLPNGILGGISGKVGNVVGSRWRGIDYIRSKPTSVKNPNTEAQQKQRSRFTLVIKLLKQIKTLLNVGYLNTGQQTPFNAAMSYHIKEAVLGEFPDFELDYEKVRFSSGGLAGSQLAEADASEPGKVTFTWVNNSEAGNASATDGAMTLLINIDRKEVAFKLFGATREDELLEQTIPAGWEGEQVAGYLAFRSDTGREVSTTQYLGTVHAAVTP